MTEAVPLSAVPGIGGATADALRDVGIRNATELAAADPQDVSRAEGIGDKRARTLIEKAAQPDLGKSYDALKEYKGRKYSGVRIGRGHSWYYDEGKWKEKKVTPDRWEFDFAVSKRRTGRAPEGSGVPVGTKYNWFILAHQVVEKLDANTYSTDMSGVKYKVSYQSADAPTWNASRTTQRSRVIAFLKDMIEELESAA